MVFCDVTGGSLTYKDKSLIANCLPPNKGWPFMDSDGVLNSMYGRGAEDAAVSLGEGGISL